MPANLKEMKPKVLRQMNQFLAEAKKQGIQLLVTQGFRSKVEQDALYAIGRTIKGNKVTNARGGESEHNYGVCFDVCGFDGKKVSYNINWAKIAQVWKSMDGTWGGDWKSFPDKPHFSYTLGYSIKAFKENKVDWTKFN